MHRAAKERVKIDRRAIVLSGSIDLGHEIVAQVATLVIGGALPERISRCACYALGAAVVAGLESALMTATTHRFPWRLTATGAGVFALTAGIAALGSSPLIHRPHQQQTTDEQATGDDRLTQQLNLCGTRVSAPTRWPAS